MKTQHEDTVKTPDGVVILKVAAGSSSAKVAGALVRYMEEGNQVALLAMGAGAVNQAVKAIAMARGMSAPQGWNLSTIPAFNDQITPEGTRKTAIQFRILKGA